MSCVFVLKSGPDDGWVEGVFTSEADLDRYIEDHNQHRPEWAKLSRENVSEYTRVDPVFNPKDYPHDPPKDYLATFSAAVAVGLEKTGTVCVSAYPVN